MRWTRRVVHVIGGQKISEFFEKEFAGIVAVQCSDGSGRHVSTFVEQRIEGSHELSHERRCLRLVFEKVNGLETRARDVGVYQTAGIGRLVQRRVVRMSGCVGFSARGAAIEMAVSERSWSVRGDAREVP
eukprot:5815632-Pleurochrysis_carterae.AAC.1